jgi:hypothetical protein
MAIGFAIFTYYTVLFATKLLNENKFIADTAGMTSTKTLISHNATEGTYIVALADTAGQPGLKIEDPSGKVLVDKQITENPAMGTFALTEDGNYTLTVTNMSPSSEVHVIFGDQKSIVGGLGIDPVTLGVVFNFTLYAGIAVFGAGVIITVLDRQRTSKMKQFGDTSDLV